MGRHRGMRARSAQTWPSVTATLAALKPATAAHHTRHADERRKYRTTASVLSNFLTTRMTPLFLCMHQVVAHLRMHVLPQAFM